MTYSIVARDAETGELAVASESHFFGVGRLVGWVMPGIGAIATQSFVNVDYGPQGLSMLAAGRSSAEALDELVDADPLRAFRQAGMVDATGTTATFTGDRCVPSAVSIAEEGVSVQGNMLAADEVVPAMLTAYRAATGPLATRVLAALNAAEEAGGDARGSQSAVLKVVSGTVSDTPWRESVVDLRVDDHESPVAELGRLLQVDRAFQTIGALLFTPGLMIGAYQDVTDDELERALAALQEAHDLLTDNEEAAFWRAVLLARAGRSEAVTSFAEVFARAPHLDAYLDKVIAAGFLAGRPR